MVERKADPDEAWTAVDEYIVDRLIPDDPSHVRDANAAAGLPDIDVSIPQGKMLHLLARACGARRVLEIGTLGGYSTVWLARAVPADGAVVTLEIDPHHAEVARANLAAAMLADRVTVITGDAHASLAALTGAFDLVFIDADKPSNVAYFAEATRLSRPGTMIIIDNVVREGDVLDPTSDDPRVQGTRALFDAIAGEPRLSATAVQTVGAKKWDGFIVALVD
ncbi:O-methyltransferase [Sphingomonas sp. NBWT7]|uniref:O-methyltransferase n=1 Tax=Sphingomonas sp. NBWT7 TaxID=2596913 RepID=UPI00162AC633|nr:O-methyltransferase [Sphingomonas sp. NBWT7]QNE31006.1 O-methyltransferase [Sphingomonas sp. NBWT7]